MTLLRPFLLLPLLLGGCAGLPDLSSWLREAPPAFGVAAAGQAGTPRALYLDMIAGLRQRGLHRAALAHLDEYERQHGATAATTLMRGQSLLEIGQERAAVAAFSAIPEGPERAAAQAGIGMALGRAGDWEGAASAFAEAVRREPTNARHVNNLGFALLRRGEAEEAEFRLRTAVELDPASPEIRNNLAVLLLATNRRPQGEQMLASVPDPALRATMRRVAAQIQQGIRPERRT